jgi:hypothetical protein
VNEWVLLYSATGTMQQQQQQQQQPADRFIASAKCRCLVGSHAGSSSTPSFCRKKQMGWKENDTGDGEKLR